MKAYIFDIGDTLEPSTAIEKEVLSIISDYYNFPEDFVYVYLKNDKFHTPHMSHAYGEPMIMKKTFFDLDIKEDYKKISKKMNELYVKKVKNYFLKDPLGSQVREVFKFLKERDYYVGILSDNRKKIKRIYEDVFGDILDVFYVSEEIGYEKPHPKTFSTILNKLNISSKDAVYFGNNLSVDKPCVNYGWHFIWVYGFMDTKRIYDGFKMDFVTLNNIKRAEKICK